MNSDSSSETKPEIAHVLTLDVVGYSKRLIDEQTAVMGDLNQLVRQSTRYRVAEAAGKLIRLPTGDGVALVFFGEPDAAMECANEIAQALTSHPRIQVRMGLHSGPVNRIVDLAGQPNVAGAGIDMAQRVMDCGDAGHILLSKRIAYDLAPLPRWNAHLHELGSVEVKHGQKIDIVNFYTDQIGNPELPAKLKRARADANALAARARWRKWGVIAAAMVLLSGMIAIGLRTYRRTFAEPPVSQSTPPEKSIAVLPFVDLSETHDQEYFCDGISEEILDTLARVEGVRVVARTSSFSFKGKNVDVSEIGRKLNVATVLEGSLRRDGNQVRVTAQLINARSGFHLWSGTIESEMAGVFEMQDRITRSIVEALKISLSLAPPARPSEDTEAYDLYLQGLALSNKSGEDDLRRSIELFQRALKRDPKFARAWTGIAKDWNWLADAYVRPKDAYPQSELAARKAIALDEKDADAHGYLGETKRALNRDLKGADQECEAALAINPNSATIRMWHALLLMTHGQGDDSLAEIHRAVRLDPLSAIVANIEVFLDLGNDRLDDAFNAAKRLMDIDPTYLYFEPDLAQVYREQGKLREALEIYERVAQTTKRESPGLAITYARLNRHDEARAVLRRLIDQANATYLPAEQIASVFVALGDNESALSWIDRAIDERSAPVDSIAFAREFRPLRADPRFSERLRRIGIDPAWFAKGSNPR